MVPQSMFLATNGQCEKEFRQIPKQNAGKAASQ